MNNLLFLLIINGFFIVPIGIIYHLFSLNLNYQYLGIYLIIVNLIALISIIIKYNIRINIIKKQMLSSNNIDRTKLKIIKKEIEKLSKKYKIKEPKIIVFQEDSINAFATGLFNSYICFSDRIFELLSDKELASVLYHEFSHIKNKDLIKQLYLESIFDSFTFYVFKIIKIFLRSILSILNIPLIFIELSFNLFFNFIGLYISRKAEFQADFFAAKEQGTSIPLIYSLTKIVRVQSSNLDYKNNFAKVNWGTDLWSTHPKIYKRIKRIESLI